MLGEPTVASCSGNLGISSIASVGSTGTSGLGTSGLAGGTTTGSGSGSASGSTGSFLALVAAPFILGLRAASSVAGARPLGSLQAL